MIDIEKIKLNLPEGVVTEGEISLSGNVATVNIISSSTGNKVISASYDDGEPVSTVLQVTDQTLFTGLVSEPALRVLTGGIVKLIASFSKVPLLSDVVITPAVGFQVHSEPTVDGYNIVAEYTAPALPATNCEFTVNFRNNTAIKSVNLVVEETPATMMSLDIAPANVRVGEDITITATFDRAPKLSNFTIDNIPGLTIKDEAHVSDNTIVAVYTAQSVGSHDIVAHYDDQVKEGSVVVLADAIITSITGDPEPVALGGTVNITVLYDKARLENQPEMQVELDVGLAEKTPYAENPEKTGGVMQVVAAEEGDKTVTFILGGTPKQLKITVNPII